MQIIGQRKFQSLDEEREKVKNILAKMEISLAFLSDTYFNSDYNPENWKLIKTEATEFFEYRLSDQKHRTHSIRITFNHPDFIDFSGPFEFFASWYKFADDDAKTTEHWRTIFRNFSRVYGIMELTYFSEDFFPLECVYDGETDFEELSALLSKETSIRKNELFGLENFNQYYIEKIKA